MAVRCSEIIKALEKLAPVRLAEKWDNVGLLLGDPSWEVSRVLLALDVDHEVVREAAEKGVHLIVSHHPLVIEPLDRIRFDTPVGRVLRELISKNIMVYTAHTNLDLAQGGVNDALAQEIGLAEIDILEFKETKHFYKIVVFVPTGYEEKIREALALAGAGHIGNYSHCAFYCSGTGSFKPLKGADPFIGEEDKLQEVSEIRLETIVPGDKLTEVVRAMCQAHPYEEVAYDIYPLENKITSYGLGRLGRLEPRASLEDFKDIVRKALNVREIKMAGKEKALISRVAVCGGAGGGLIKSAAYRGADVFVTGDVKYHEAQEARALGLMVLDAGHDYTERPVLKVLKRYLEQEFCVEDIHVLISGIETDPWTKGRV